MNAGPIPFAVVSSLGLGLVLSLRRTVQRHFGASTAFALWALPPLWLLCLSLPTSNWLPTNGILRVLAEQSEALRVTTVAGTRAWSLWPVIWVIGASLMLLRLMRNHWQALRGHEPVPAWLATAVAPLLGGLPASRLRLGPDVAVLGLLPARILLPADFLERFSAAERGCILRHELAHIQRGDPYWMGLAQCLLALLWWHPLAWLSLPRFRLDMELACDERCLRAHPEERGQYAKTLLHSAGLAPAPAHIPWFHLPQLKERLLMIQHSRDYLARRRLGLLAISLLLVGGAFIAQATNQTTRPASADAAWNLKNATPHYPQDAIKNKESGLVWLTVLVGKDGQAKHVDIDQQHSTTQSPSLLKAASDIALHWHYRPTLQDGKPAEGYARIPIQFDLTPQPTAPASSNS